MIGKQKFFILEDDQYTRDVYQKVLIGAGYDVSTAVDGEEGGYQLILLDMICQNLMV